MKKPNILEPLCYWDNAGNDPSFPCIRPHRYVTFDLDQGGLNNIRLVLEYVTVIAAITGRSLVLPPGQPWYLINYGPIAGGEPGGHTEIDDVFNVAALREGVPVLSTPEFISEASEHLLIPDDFQNPAFVYRDEDANKPPINAWQEWLLNNTEVVPWDPYDMMICLPDIKSVIDSVDLADDYVDGRELVEFSPAMLSSPVIHFPSNQQYRALGPVATMLAAKEQNLPGAGRRLLKHHVRYSPVFFEQASKIIKWLGHNDYDAIHIRRNDFQYEETQLNAKAIIDNIRPLLDSGLALYIATDEIESEFFKEISREYRVVRWLDVIEGMDEKIDIPAELIGPVEQIVCAGARRFIGTDLSTFSTYINRMRGYISAPDTLSYYHSIDYRKAGALELSRHSRGRDYLRENPLFWTDC